MTKKRRKSSVINKTDLIDVAFGAFNIGEYRVPFMSSVIRFDQAAEYLNLVTEDGKYAKQDWSITELFQREVDLGRVHDMANNYLNPARIERPPFFNSITVVLNPSKNHKGKYNTPKKDDGAKNCHSVGPITINYDESDDEGDFPAAGSFGSIQWNRDQVYAVAIDGQHRLAAIKELYKKKRKAGAKCSVSVLFLVIDECVGFIVPKKEDPVYLMRQLFIDLNKYAVPVSRARNLLLDDRDPLSLFLREIIGQNLTYTATNNENDGGIKIGKNGEFETCLPLDLIDWHGESRSKVDQGPYVSSILALEWIIRAVLKGGSPGNRIVEPKNFSPDDDDYYTKLNKVYSTWPLTWEKHIKKRLSECENNKRSFILDIDELGSLKEEFKELWGSALTRILTTAGPYLDLSNERIKSKTISPQFGQWAQAKSDYDANQNRGAIAKGYLEKLNNVEDELKDIKVNIKRFETTITNIEEKIKKDNVLFYLVGQRALINSFVTLCSSDMFTYWSEWADIDLSRFEKGGTLDFYAFYLVEAINAIHKGFDAKTGLLYRNRRVKRKGDGITSEISDWFWAGSLVLRDNPETVDFSEAAAKRGAKWFTIFAHLFWLKITNSKGVKKSHVLRAVEDPDAITQFAFGEEVVEAIGDLVGDVFSSGSMLYDCPMAFLVKVLEEPSYDIVYAATRERLDYICNCLDIK